MVPADRDGILKFEIAKHLYFSESKFFGMAILEVELNHDAPRPKTGRLSWRFTPE